MGQDNNKFVAIIAGGSGMVGSELLKEMLEDSPISHIYALTRSPLPFMHPKLEIIQNENLHINNWDDNKLVPKLGFICLGTTRNQAGSSSELEKVDFGLVCEVAQTMKLLGVTHLSVISSYGASKNTPSHYLRCKGKMEIALSGMGFEKLLIVRPGPLVGMRDTPRKSEVITLALLDHLKPIMRGPLTKLIPINARHVALAMLFGLLDPNLKRHTILNSDDILTLLNDYQSQ
ncbi:oxidoreductase [Vibrio marisflavi]|uniref:Nucleoside-diphosphate sugar epimerase n=1 Tax=Vibrio marisflavi CECT 7928 TaxID=634439 RepID=A0ABN8E458_9VIBR|nr:oxidoreductase [Vibrio marisflavi]CAH0539682.1 hypothetical protein VMF7928_02359 [Vibrio marisflavi CECT 7928]